MVSQKSLVSELTLQFFVAAYIQEKHNLLKGADSSEDTKKIQTFKENFFLNKNYTHSVACHVSAVTCNQRQQPQPPFLLTPPLITVG